MNVDTITGPRVKVRPVAIQQYYQEAIVWGYHSDSDKKTLPKDLQFGVSLIAAITLSGALIFSFSSKKTYAIADSPKKSSFDLSIIEELKKKVLSNANFRNLKIATPKPELIESLKPKEIKPPVQNTTKGGFDSVYIEAEKKYGVPWQILAGVHYVETRQSGDSNAESKAGALGPMQFMPATFDAYKQDGDNDGKISISDVHDAIFTAAKNLKANGADKGNIAEALYNYNHSHEYVEKVLNYARSLGYSK